MWSLRCYRISGWSRSRPSRPLPRKRPKTAAWLSDDGPGPCHGGSPPGCGSRGFRPCVAQGPKGA
eukprot:15475940-Alexandrium_andersonii.AAC.1